MPPVKTPTKAPAKAKPTAQPKPVSAETTIVSIPLEKLHRHAANRTITPDSVADLVESIREHGQREPIRVRPLADPIGHFEILSGERRFVAAGQIPGIESLRAIVEHHSDPQSLIELAVANAARQDLNPIERAELLEKLIAPAADGEAAMDRAAAGRLFGLNSESGVKNALRLLKLPRRIRELVAAGKVPIAKARPLCAYPDELLEAFAKWLFDPKQRGELEQFAGPVLYERDETEAIRSFLYYGTRPADNQAKHSLGWDKGGQLPPLFKMDDATKETLRVVEIPKDDGKGSRLVALNCIEWDVLQLPYAKAKAAKQSGKAGPSAKVEAAGEKSKPTAAELKARRKKADEQLARYTADWVRESLRCAISSGYDLGPVVALWLFGELETERNYADPKLADYLEWVVADSGQMIQHAHDPAKLDKMGPIMISHAAALALWPVATTSRSHSDLAEPGTIPEALPTLDDDVVDELAESLGVSIADVWKSARTGGPLRDLVRRWLARHTLDQLADLATELGVKSIAKKRDEAVEDILAEHGQNKSLKLPAALAKFMPAAKSSKLPAKRKAGR